MRQAMEESRRSERKRVKRMRFFDHENPERDYMMRPMRFVCVSWLREEGYELDEIATFLGWGREIVDALADVVEYDFAAKLGPKAKLAKERGLI
jgi:hypothetical protein